MRIQTLFGLLVPQEASIEREEQESVCNVDYEKGCARGKAVPHNGLLNEQSGHEELMAKSIRRRRGEVIN